MNQEEIVNNRSKQPNAEEPEEQNLARSRLLDTNLASLHVLLLCAPSQALLGARSTGRHVRTFMF